MLIYILGAVHHFTLSGNAVTHGCRYFGRTVPSHLRTYLSLISNCSLMITITDRLIQAIYPTLIIILMSIQKISTLPGETVLSRSLQLSEAMMSSDQSEASSSLVVPGFRVQKEMV